MSTQEIGHLVLEHLRGLGPPADAVRIRFALVFHAKFSDRTGFRKVADFITWLEEQYDVRRADRSVQRSCLVVTRERQFVPFDEERLARSIALATEGLGTDDQVRSVAINVATAVGRELRDCAIVSSSYVAGVALKIPRDLNPLSYVLYASVTNDFRSADDFWLEVSTIDP